MRYKQSIVYVNFSPYDNAGRILDFLCSRFSLVIHFSYDHLRLKNGRKTNILTIYKNGIIIEKKFLIPLRTPEFLRFPSLPIVALLIFLQTYWYTYKAKRQFHAITYYFTVNAYTAWIGTYLKKMKFVKKTIFWVWDYFPPGYPDWRIKIMRWVYWKFDKPSVLATDIVTSISDRLMKLRYDVGAIPFYKKYTVIPIGTNPINKIQIKKGNIIGFLGMLKQSQGLDLLFNSMDQIHKEFPDITFEFIGSGPEEMRFRKRANRWKNICTFHGYIEREADVEHIMQKWSIGLATYLPIPSNESYWTDPSKIKAYLSQGVPVITTDVPQFAKEIAKYKAGIVISYYQPRELINAINTLMKNKYAYAQNALRLAQKYTYVTLYKKFFSQGVATRHQQIRNQI